ncbi:hypothetical protein SAMN02745121_09147, partial [Nannocystis exedens]
NSVGGFTRILTGDNTRVIASSRRSLGAIVQAALLPVRFVVKGPLHAKRA